MTAPPITLKVGGKAYGGWKSVRVTRSIEALAGSFSLGLTEKWAGQAKPWPIGDNDACSVCIDDVPIITGFLDTSEPSFDANTRSMAVTGRDRAADLVDCSAQLGAWSFKNVSVLELAKKIAAPYGCEVSLQAGLVAAAITIPKKYSIDPGDTAATALENLCKVAGLLAISDGIGGILLTRTGTERVGTLLVEGQNILSASGKFDGSGRFRNYEVMGSHKGRNDLNGANAAGVKGTATDLNARAGRVLIIRPDTGVTPVLAKQRAEWEATVRAARGESVSATVQGWNESDLFGVWPLNKLVRIKSPTCRVNGDALIAGVTFAFDVSSGTTTTLDLRNPKAFTVDPSIAGALSGSGGNNYWREIEHGV